GRDATDAELVERVGHHRGHRLSSIAMTAVRRIEDVADLSLGPLGHAGLAHPVEHIERYGPDHYTVKDHCHAVIVGVIHRVPPGGPEYFGLNRGAHQPAVALRQVAVLEEPVDVLVLHRAMLKTVGAQAGGRHSAGR